MYEPDQPSPNFLRPHSVARDLGFESAASLEATCPFADADGETSWLIGRVRGLEVRIQVALPTATYLDRKL